MIVGVGSEIGRMTAIAASFSCTQYYGDSETSDFQGVKDRALRHYALERYTNRHQVNNSFLAFGFSCYPEFAETKFQVVSRGLHSKMGASIHPTSSSLSCALTCFQRHFHHTNGHPLVFLTSS